MNRVRLSSAFGYTFDIGWVGAYTLSCDHTCPPTMTYWEATTMLIPTVTLFLLLLFTPPLTYASDPWYAYCISIWEGKHCPTKHLKCCTVSITEHETKQYGPLWWPITPGDTCDVITKIYPKRIYKQASNGCDIAAPVYLQFETGPWSANPQVTNVSKYLNCTDNQSINIGPNIKPDKPWPFDIIVGSKGISLRAKL